MGELTAKYQQLRIILARYESLIVAFSGGVDSTLLLKVACEVLGSKVLAITADSPSVPRREIAETQRLAVSIGARHLVIPTGEIHNADYLTNPPNRCYFCKSELYSKLAEIARREKIRYLANGTNVDDLGDYRPGLQAAAEYQVVSPLKESGFTKSDVRELAKRLHLKIWNKPASPCLSSRIPYGMEVTPRKLAAIEAAESYLRDLGVGELRVRHFGKKARIETAKGDFGIIEKNYRQIVQKFNTIGFEELEIAEFKSGALNAALGKLPQVTREKQG